MDREWYIFPASRGYRRAKQDREDASVKGSKNDSGKGGDDGEQTNLKEDELIPKKADREKMEEELKELRKEVKEVDALKRM